MLDSSTHIDYNEIFAFMIANDMHMFCLIFVFVVLGGSAYDYFESINKGQIKIKLLTIIISSFAIALGIFSQMYRFENLKFLLFLSYIAGFSHYSINAILIKFSNNEGLIKKILLKILGGITNLSEILQDNNKDE